MDESIAGCEHCNGTGVTSDAHTGGGVWDSLGSLGNAFGNAASGFTGALGQAGTAFGQNLLQQGQAAYGNARGAVNGAVNGFAQQGRDAYGNAQAAANGYAQQGRAALGNAQAYGQNLAQQGAQFGQNAAQQGAQYGQNFAQRGVNALNNGAAAIQRYAPPPQYGGPPGYDNGAAGIHRVAPPPQYGGPPGYGYGARAAGRGHRAAGAPPPSSLLLRAKGHLASGRGRRGSGVGAGAAWADKPGRVSGAGWGAHAAAAKPWLSAINATAAGRGSGRGIPAGVAAIGAGFLAGRGLSVAAGALDAVQAGPGVLSGGDLRLSCNSLRGHGLRLTGGSVGRRGGVIPYPAVSDGTPMRLLEDAQAWTMRPTQRGFHGGISEEQSAHYMNARRDAAARAAAPQPPPPPPPPAARPAATRIPPPPPPRSGRLNLLLPAPARAVPPQPPPRPPARPRPGRSRSSRRGRPTSTGNRFTRAR